MARLASVLLAVALAAGLLAAQDYNEPFRPQAGGVADIAHVSTNSTVTNNGSGDTSACTTPALSTTTGRHLVCSIRYEGAATTISSVTDTASNSWTINAAAHATNTLPTPDVSSALVYAENITGNASNQVTINLTAASAWFMCTCGQYSGVPTSSLDTAYGTSGIITDTATSSNAVDWSASSTSVAAVVVCAVTNQSGRSITWTGTFTERVDAPGGNEISISDRIVTSSTSVQANAAPVGGGWEAAGVCMAFKDF